MLLLERRLPLTLPRPRRPRGSSREREVVDALVGGGLVTRESHPTDRRATLVTLTASGKKLTAMLKRDHRALAHALFAQMSGGEFDSFERGLAAVITNRRTPRNKRNCRKPFRKAVASS